MKKTNYRMVVRTLAVMAVAAAVALFAACSDGDDKDNSEKGTEFTVTFDTNGGSPAQIDSIKVVEGQSMGSKYPTSPTKSGNTFKGWYEGSTKYTADTKITKDVGLKAEWTVVPPQMVMGTVTNPLFKCDVPDVSLIRVNDAYYMVSTTMYFMPVAPIMKSYDLVNWKIVSYCGDILEDLPNFNLEPNANRLGDYGRGQWAASIRYFKERFWVIFKNNTTNRSYRYSTADPDNGPWEQVIINRGFHDPSIVYDEEHDKTYIIQGADTITITEMTNDLTAVKPGGIDKTIITGSGGLEGSQVFYYNGYYYLFLINWPSGGRRMVHCYRTTNIEGPYEDTADGHKVVLNNAFSGGGGVAQGCIIDTPNGDWYGMFFQDRGAVGRIPFLIPMTWEDGWPVFGANSGNNVGTIPPSFEKELAQGYETNLFYSDEFEYSSNKPHLAWQWNHNPDNANWSFTENPGYLRLKTGRISRTVYHARNTLTQRTRESSCSAEVALETTAMKDGDIAGVVALQALCGFVGIEQTDGQKNVVMYTGDNDSQNFRGDNAAVTQRASVPFTGSRIYLKANFVGSTATFAYKTDEQQNWQSIGTSVNLTFSLQHFTGVRFGLFNYATKEIGGYVDFDYYHFQFQ
jgi:beta-xylosidase